jgi:predicted methyltransferase
MLVSGLPMHRIKNTDPHRDTLEKIRAARPAGNVLDTCTGLGYTAIEASKLASVAQVTTIELDPTVLQICRANPWSQALFDNTKITQIIGDSFDVIDSFPDGTFSFILHDPPSLSLAGDLYSLDFYRRACRVLSRNGRLFHYIGDPESKSGRSATAGAIKRLEQAGFRHIERAPRAFGVVASKRF